VVNEAAKRMNLTISRTLRRRIIFIRRISILREARSSGSVTGAGIQV